MNELMILIFLILFPFALLTVCMIPAMVAARFEKRMVWPFGPVMTAPPTGDATGTGGLGVDEALGAGFTMIGWMGDAKGKSYAISYAMLVSEDRTTIAEIGVGKLMGMTVNSAWIYSLTKDGRAFCTNNILGREFDPARQILNQYSSSTSVRELYVRHVDLLKTLDYLPALFEPGREIEQFRIFLAEHYRRLADMGVIYFTSPEETHWRYTTWGAIRLPSISGVISVARALSGGRFPRLM